ncbi:type VII secretion-associated protein [Corynebacterium liangguodongii]|uniref:Type VII secretion-associated protein n=1 Tax=Corynebacterium liangguodongii TaxID=2079535 RepID=A0A2S0WCB9_9CORY|nr:type VII secretion-associated protein [Corynebacterium liangguodongii]AWB83408.1 type VII secretion-associated protein [Corynebacterium liangguodongii]PWC00502.1 type VII secretion-associated protein [Corynebacterium liangguodongii]
MTTTLPDLKVTITPEATIFEGLANVRRYDRPTPAEIAHYVASVVGPEAAAVRVAVVASEADFAELSRALDGSGIELAHERSSGRHALVDAHAATDPDPAPHPDPIDDPIEVTRPTEADGARRMTVWSMLAVALAALLCVAAVYYTATSLRPAPVDAGDGAGNAVGDAVGNAVGDEAGTEASTRMPSPTPTVISREGLLVEVPAGFSAAPDGDMWRLTGKDPDLRVQLAVDPLFELPPERLIAQVLEEIEADPSVELLDNSAGALTYRETGNDGSQSLWRTWVEAGHQISVGCHTRAAPSQVQQATCTMAMESATFNAEDAAG